MEGPFKTIITSVEQSKLGHYIYHCDAHPDSFFNRAMVIIAPSGGVSYPSVLLPYVDGNPREHVILDPGYR